MTVQAQRVTAESRQGKGESVRERLDSEFKKKRNGDDKIGRKQTIVIKLSMRNWQSCKALIRFNHL